MPTADDDDRRRRGRAGDVARGVAIVVLAVLATVSVWFLFATPTGRAARDNPRHAAADLRGVVAAHPVAASAALLGAYLTLAVLCLPVWWLQLFAGVAFGLCWGGVICLLGSAIGAAITAALAEWLAGDWFHQRVEGRRERLRSLDEALGHNGLLTVMAIRLTHVVPFGLSNVALGLSRVTNAEVLVGTLLGNVPAVAIYVGVGAGYRPLTNWRFDVAVGAVNVVLLVPLAVRYWKPGWFRRFGLE
jgi:uncharacterized membrane protein YdjX (TVP38/TMEM64 family)